MEILSIGQPAMPTFSHRQTRFIEEYLVDGNATQAAIRAGYSQRSAHSQGHENLRKPEISAEIARRREAMTEKTAIDAAWVIRRLAAEAMRDGQGASHGARVAALSTLARALGMFRETPAPPEEDRLATLLQEISRRGSVAPVVRDISQMQDFPLPLEEADRVARPAAEAADRKAGTLLPPGPKVRSFA